MTKAKELRDQSVEELEANYNDTCKALFNLVNSRKTTKKNDKPHLSKQLRKRESEAFDSDDRKT